MRGLLGMAKEGVGFSEISPTCPRLNFLYNEMVKIRGGGCMSLTHEEFVKQLHMQNFGYGMADYVNKMKDLAHKSSKPTGLSLSEIRNLYGLEILYLQDDGTFYLQGNIEAEKIDELRHTLLEYKRLEHGRKSLLNYFERVSHDTIKGRYVPKVNDYIDLEGEEFRVRDTRETVVFPHRIIGLGSDNNNLITAYFLQLEST
jgi:hypothetical protein